MALTLVYETHATTTDNEAGIATGWLPGELSADGRRQARELGARRRDDGIDEIHVSDLARAVETVRLAFPDRAPPVVVDRRLRECNYGALNGMPRALLDAERARHVDEPWPGGESYRDVVERMRSFLADLQRARASGRVLVIGHAATRLALDHLLAGRDLREVVEAPFEWRPGWEYAVPAEPAPDAALRRGPG